MKKNFLLIAGIGALLLIILNWDKLMAFARPTAKTNDAGTAGTLTTPAPAKVEGNANPAQLLKRGDKSASVQKLQTMIIDGWGAQMLPKYGADGDFGAETEAALKAITGSSSTTLTTFQMNYYQKQKANPALVYVPGAGVGAPAPAAPWYWIPGF